MPHTEFTPRKLQLAAHAGNRRLRNFRNARMMFLRSYVGSTYDSAKGTVGTEPLNLIFNAIRVLVPNLVMNFPKFRGTSNILAHRPYADLLGEAVTWHGKHIKIEETYRKWIVDAIFMLGTTKTGLASSDTVVGLDDLDDIRVGEVFTELVSYDNLVIDPTVRQDFREGGFIGDRIQVPRHVLLDSGLYDNALVERLPAIHAGGHDKRAEELSRQRMDQGQMRSFSDRVEVVELYVPSEGMVVTMPGSKDTSFDNFLRTHEHIGLDEGPYTFLSFTPPVPDNPNPISMVGIWHDLHIMANRMAHKIMDQASRQKDVTLYRPGAVDTAVEVRDAGDGDMVMSDDPTSINTLSVGGQQPSNEAHINQLQSWFNMMAANPQGVGGLDLRADSATEASILRDNADVGLSDMKDLFYKAVQSEAEKRTFFFHTDPLINLPMIRRQLVDTPQGPQAQDVQVILTPELRRGDFQEFAVELQPESMGRKDASRRLEEAKDLFIQILPSIAQTATLLNQMGIPFDAMRAMTNMAKDRGVEWFDELSFDPRFAQKQELLMLQGPQLTRGQPGAPRTPGNQPNGQPGTVMASTPSPDTQSRQEAQAGAADSQSEMRSV